MNRTGMRALTADEEWAVMIVHDLIDAGVIGRESLRMTEDANFKAMWEAACDIARQRGWTNLNDMHRIAADQPGSRPIRAINTTAPHQLGENP